MASAGNDLGLQFNTVEDALKGLNAQRLDANVAWDADVLAEARLLQTWGGHAATLAHSNGGTAAYTCGLVAINRTQLDKLFSGFKGEEYKTAIFFALAHEFGHLAQFRHFGVNWTLNDCPRIEIEAHADILSGVWLGLRLTQGEMRTPDAAMNAGLQLKGGTANYPSAYQRGVLVQEGLGRAALLVGALEPQIRDPGYTKFADGLTKQDVIDLLETSRKLLREVPSRR